VRFVCLWRSQMRCGYSLCTVHSASACFVLESYVLTLLVKALLAQYIPCLILEQETDRVCVIKRHPVKMSGGGGVVPRILQPVVSQLPQPCSVIPGQDPPGVWAPQSVWSLWTRNIFCPEINFRFSRRIPTLTELCRINCNLKVITGTLVSDIPNRTLATHQLVWLTETNLRLQG